MPRIVGALRIAATLGLWLSANCAPLFAQFAPWSTAPQTPLPAVVRVTAPERDGASLGSGTLIDVSQSHGLVLTNWHVVRDAVGNVIVSFPDGFQSPGYVIKMDRDWDLAAVATWRPHVAPVPIATEAPRPGEMLTIAGYGAGNYRAISGPCSEYLSPGPNLPYEIVELHAAARHGDSGGPILNSRGELAGVLFGEGGGDTSGTYCGRVRLFLASIGPGTAPQIASAAGAGISRPAPSQQPSLPRMPASTANNLAAVGPISTNYPPITLPPMVPIGALSGAQPSSMPTPPTPLSPSMPTAMAMDPHFAGPVAAILSPLPPMPPVQSGAGGGQATAGEPREDRIGWEQIAGHTWGEQLKTVLAGIGAIIVLLQIIRKVV